MLQTWIFIFVFYILGMVLSARNTSMNRNPCPLGANNLVEEDRLSGPWPPFLFSSGYRNQRPGQTLPSKISVGQAPKPTPTFTANRITTNFLFGIKSLWSGSNQSAYLTSHSPLSLVPWCTHLHPLSQTCLACKAWIGPSSLCLCLYHSLPFGMLSQFSSSPQKILCVLRQATFPALSSPTLTFLSHLNSFNSYSMPLLTVYQTVSSSGASSGSSQYSFHERSSSHVYRTNVSIERINPNNS